ncbi:MAG: hypothetical protein QW424_00790 [Candidatus Bathyarchaeia archaeon]
MSLWFFGFRFLTLQAGAVETAANILELKKMGMLRQDGGDMVPANYPDATFYINQT